MHSTLCELIRVIEEGRKIKTYRELITLPTFIKRYDYLRIGGVVGETTFGYERYLNQVLYNSQEWKLFRRDIILRDNGCDLAHEDFGIGGRIIVHHINPISIEDIERRSSKIFDYDNVICTSHYTHLAIHYGDKELLPSAPVIRRPNDTCLWKD